MAQLSDGIIYYDKNVIRALDKWNILSGASVIGGFISVQSGGIAGIDLTNEYSNGLKASKYRRVVFVVEADISNQNNYTNYIEILIRCVYKDSDGNKLVERRSVNTPQLGSTVTEAGYKYSFVLSMENYDLDSCTLYIANHSTESIVLKSCEMKRSQDISGSQVGESIGYNVTLQEVAEYLDGLELFYENISKTDKLWWMDDENDELCGINVNNERMIKLSRYNTILLD